MDYDAARMAVCLSYDAVDYCYKGDERLDKEGHITPESIADLLGFVNICGETLGDANESPGTWPVLAKFQRMRASPYRTKHEFEVWLAGQPHDPEFGCEDNWWRRMGNTYALVAEIAEAQGR